MSRFGPNKEGPMLRAVRIASHMPFTSVSAALAQENAIERSAHADTGIGIIPWIIIALVIAGTEFWTMRSRRR